MADEITGNLLVAQSGGLTSALNASLAGVVTEALNHGCVEEIYGGLHGVQGLLQEELIDLAEESQQNIRGLRYTPGAALGTTRFKLTKEQDLERLLAMCEAHNIRFFTFIGDLEAMQVAARLHELAEARGYALRVVGIPKAVDNTLGVTDHCPGYGSVAKYIATLVRELIIEHEGSSHHDFVSILEVGGRNTGWIAAGSTLARRKNQLDDPPHIVVLPEVPLNPERFIEAVQATLKRQRFCLIVVAEGIVDQNGNYVGASNQAKDAFGQQTFGHASEYLRLLVEQQLGVRVRAAKLGLTQRVAGHCASLTDTDEAYLCGQAAVRAAVAGESGKMVTLVRGDSDHYSSETGLVLLADVIAAGLKPFPPTWINDDGLSLSFQYAKYALPLIQGEVKLPFENGVPKFVTLTRSPVGRKLESYVLEQT
ncbi:MAG: 6-phosphofructokinase [Opitutales bacterium]|jgi:6-phosphofructokinase 1